MRRSADRLPIRTIVVAVVLAAALGACSDIYYDRRESVSFQAGDAPKSNVIAQTIDPWSRASANRHITHNGERMQRAIDRYRTNKTTPLMTTGTSSINLQAGQSTPATPGTP
jgi:type IV pilus biogenesis protein CpaD/CtpE